jgi:RNA polymerase sigma-70 factor (ECF subfamily)
MESTSESLLFRLNAVDNSDAWFRFVELYTPLIFYWARRSGLPTQDASDLVQDVVGIVFQKLPQFKYDPEKSFRGWLRTITLNRYRQLCRRKRINLIDASGSLLGNLADPKQAESTWDLNYARQLVAAAMDSLRDDFAPPTWEALTQLMKTGQTAADVSRETGISVWTIYAAKSRLMKRLRTELDGLLE